MVLTQIVASLVSSFQAAAFMTSNNSYQKKDPSMNGC